MTNSLRLAACTLLLATSGVLAQGQSRTFDIATLSPPAGWTAAAEGDHITWSLIDKAAGTFCMFTVYESQPASADPAADFASEWNALVAASFTAPNAPTPTPRKTAAGQSYMEAGGIVKQGDTPYYADLNVMLAVDRVQSIVVVATTAAVARTYQPQLTAFLASVKYAARAAAAPATGASSGSAAGAKPTTAADLGSIKGKGIVGVWMGFVTVMGQSTPEPRWITFYDDGQALRDIPLPGLDGFDRSASKADPDQVPYWATYTWNGSTGSIAVPGSNSPIAIKAKSANQIYLDSALYYRCPEVDGVRLQGSWTSYGDTHDPALGRLEAGKKPIISLSKDGRFVDEGIFASFFQAFDGLDPAQIAAGTGTYEIRRYSLILHYADGRTKKSAITGVAGSDIAANADIIYLYRSRMNMIK